MIRIYDLQSQPNQELNLSFNLNQYDQVRHRLFNHSQEQQLKNMFMTTPLISRKIQQKLLNLFNLDNGNLNNNKNNQIIVSVNKQKKFAGQTNGLNTNINAHANSNANTSENKIDSIDKLIDEQKDKKFKLSASEIVDGDDQQFVCPINWDDRQSFGFFTFDIQNGVDQLDDNLKRIYELDRPIDPDKQNLYREWTKLIVYEHVALLHHAHDRAYQTGIYSVKFKVKLPHSGNEIWIQCCGNVLYDENKKPRFLIGVAGVVNQ